MHVHAHAPFAQRAAGGQAVPVALAHQGAAQNVGVLHIPEVKDAVALRIGGHGLEHGAAGHLHRHAAAHQQAAALVPPAAAGAGRAVDHVGARRNPHPPARALGGIQRGLNGGGVVRLPIAPGAVIPDVDRQA